MNTNLLSCSVAMATYNGEKYLYYQLKSIDEQTHKPNEIVICDDSSTDRTIEIIKRFAEETSINVSLYINKDKLGYSKNFEKAVSLCSNDIIFFCDQDDVWFCNKIEVMLNEFALDPDLIYAFCNGYVTDEDLNVTKKSAWLYNWNDISKQEFFNVVQRRLIPLGCQSAVRRDFVNSITPFPFSYDQWIASCAVIVGSYKAIDEPLYYYRRHANATSGAELSSSKELQNRPSASRRHHLKREFDSFFGYPKSEYTCYTSLLNVYNTMGSDLNVDELNNGLTYSKKLCECKNGFFVSNVVRLIYLYKKGFYTKFRGNFNSLIFDLVYLFFYQFRKKSDDRKK